MQVDKLLGPGNQYVTAAKMLLQNSEAMVSIDMPAGPSEVLVIADAHASPAFIAADLLSQAEHGPDSQVPYLRMKSRRAGQQRLCVWCGLVRETGVYSTVSKSNPGTTVSGPAYHFLWAHGSCVAGA